METENEILLARKERAILGKEIRYILLARGGGTTSFLVTVEYCGEAKTCSLGSSFSGAAEIFRALEEGLVTPCTLAEVVVDLQKLRTTI